MGWSDSSLVFDIIEIATQTTSIHVDIKKSVAKKIIARFQNDDFDCVDELMGEYEWLDKVVHELMGYSPECKGRCAEIRCMDEDCCGCPCHMS